VDIEDGSGSTIGLISLHPVAAFLHGLQEIGRLEDLGIGLTSSAISETDAPSGCTFANAIESFIVDVIIWAFSLGVSTESSLLVLEPRFPGAFRSPLRAGSLVLPKDSWPKKRES
jgi:hypothetical protein